ncbi:MAG: septum formation inhibitor Maf [Atopobiaceae bacterium]|nr:septum formation inhibitor Maf [Atopobiaceae bacterium]
MILASASPRRKELLERAGFELTIVPADVDESRQPDEKPIDLVARLATLKAHACLKSFDSLTPGETLLGADTIVWLDDDVLGKPRDDADAMRMLHELSGKTHHVSTGVCLLMGGSHHVKERVFVETSHVTFRVLTDDEIRAYVATGEPLDKAGSYAIQGGAQSFVEQLDGDYDNVVGLPVTRVLCELESAQLS